MRAHRGLWVPLMHLFASWVITTDLRLDCPSIRGQSSCATIVLWKGNNCSTVQAFSYTFWAIFMFSLQFFSFSLLVVKFLFVTVLWFTDVECWVPFLVQICNVPAFVCFPSVKCPGGIPVLGLWEIMTVVCLLPPVFLPKAPFLFRSAPALFSWFFFGGGGVLLHPEIAARYFPAIVHIKPGKTLR